MEDITVFAQKTEQNVQDVGISIATFSEQELKINHPTDIASHVLAVVGELWDEPLTYGIDASYRF